MSRAHHHKHSAPDGSQRPLRAGKLVRQVLLFLPIPTPVFAELCDKAVGESWRPEHGPVWLLNPVGFPIGLAVLTGVLVWVGVAKSGWPGFICASLILGIVAIGLMPTNDPDPMWLSLLKEGCISERANLMNTYVLVAFAFAYAFLGFIARMRRAKTI
jgi:hypothetical protein